MLEVPDLIEEFWSLVDIRGPDECWLYVGKGDMFKRVIAPVLACATRIGPPGDLFTLHSCDNPPCCNPAHLRQGTHEDNVRDMVERGRCLGRCGTNPNSHGNRRGKTYAVGEADEEEILSLIGIMTKTDIADLFGISRMTVHNITKRRGVPLS
jgi:hypothetical protein